METPAEPSAFMTTNSQSPSAGSQSSRWVPDPVASAIQKSWSAGGSGRLAAGHDHLVERRGPQVVDHGALDTLAR